LFKVMKRPPLIVEQMALVSGTGFHGAAFQGNLQLIQEMITRSCDVASSAHRFGMTPLHIAAYSGHQEVAAQLVAAGAPLHIKDKRGRTPASWAKYRGHTELASSLTRPSKGEQSVRV
jgi:cytohesin